MEPTDELAPYEVFEGSAWEAGLLLSILDDNEIEAFQKDTSRIPWNTFPVASSAVKVFVAYRDFGAASAIVTEFRKNMQKEPETSEE
jgi:hypothetical protein